MAIKIPTIQQVSDFKVSSLLDKATSFVFKPDFGRVKEDQAIFVDQSRKPSPRPSSPTPSVLSSILAPVKKERFNLGEQFGALGEIVLGGLKSLPDSPKKTAARFGAQYLVGTADFIAETADFVVDNISSTISKQPLVGIGPFSFTPETDKRKKEAWVGFVSKSKLPTEKIKDAIDRIQEDDFLQPSQAWVDAPLTEKLSTRLGETALQIGPSILSSFQMFALNPVLGLVTIGGATANDVKDQAIDYGVPEKQAELLGLSTGILVSVLERIVPSKLFANGGIRNQFLGSFARRIGETSLLEAGTEITQENIQIAAEATFRDDLGWDEVKTRNALSALAGAIGGGGMQTIVSFANDVQREEILNELKNIKPGLTIEDVSGGILSNLPPKAEYSRQELQDAMSKTFKQQGLRLEERQVIDDILQDFEGNKINAIEFAEKLKARIIPLDINDPESISFVEEDEVTADDFNQYEGISLPDDVRGNVADYKEIIYESPIPNSAGEVHFNMRPIVPENYFAHTRVEDMASPSVQQGAMIKKTPAGWELQDASGKKIATYRYESEAKTALEFGGYDNVTPGSTRRVIEIQSDLFQKGRLEGEQFSKNAQATKEIQALPKDDFATFERNAIEIAQKYNADLSRVNYEQIYQGKVPKSAQNDIKGLSRLEPYRNTWWERIIQEEILRAKRDGKTSLLFPTGETIMKIEGLGAQRWGQGFWTDLKTQKRLEPENLKRGMEISGNPNASEGQKWIITEVLGDGKFKAAPKTSWDAIAESLTKRVDEESRARYIEGAIGNRIETFDISGEVDKNNAQYRRYENVYGKYLQKRFDAKRIEDENDISWFEVKPQEVDIVVGVDLINQELDRLTADQNIPLGLSLKDTSKNERFRASAEVTQGVNELLEKATKHQPKFTKDMQAIAKELGLEVQVGPVKGAERTIEKVVTEKDGDVSQIFDANRAVMFIEDFNGSAQLLTKATQLINDKVGKVTAVNRRMGQPGYNNLWINFETPAGIAELQFTTPAIWDAKVNQGGHILYEEWRKPGTPKELADQLNTMMNDLYAYAEESSVLGAQADIKEGGFTRDILRNINFAGTPHIAVSPFPERTQKYEGGVNGNAIADYFVKNKDLLMQEGYAMGGWVEDGTLWLDISVPVPKSMGVDFAKKLGKAANQKAIFDLEAFEEIDTGGTGEVEGAAPVEERLAMIGEIQDAIAPTETKAQKVPRIKQSRPLRKLLEATRQGVKGLAQPGMQKRIGEQELQDLAADPSLDESVRQDAASVNPTVEGDPVQQQIVDAQTKEGFTPMQVESDELTLKELRDRAGKPRIVGTRTNLFGEQVDIIDHDDIYELNTRKIKATKDYQEWRDYAIAQFQDKDINPAATDLGHVSFTAERLAEFYDEGIGGRMYKEMIKPVYDAARAATEEFNELASEIKSFKVLEGSTDDMDAFLYAEKKKTDVSDRAKAIANHIRSLYDDLLVRMNEERAKLGIEPIPKRKDYITHLNELTVLAELMGNDRITVNHRIRELARRLMEEKGYEEGRAWEAAKREVEGATGVMKYIDAKHPRFSWAKERLGDFQKNPSIIRSIKAYLPQAIRYIHQAENVAKNKAYKDVLPANAKEFMRKWNTEQVAGRPNSGWLSPLAKKIIAPIRGTLGANTILGNAATTMMQLTSFPQVFAHAGVRNTFYGIYKRLTSYVTGNNEFNQSRVKALRDLGIDMGLGDSVLDSLLNTIGKHESAKNAAARGRQAIDVGRQFLQIIMEKADQFTVGATYEAFYRKGIHEGMSAEDATEYAEIMTGKTQANYFKEAIPPFLNSFEGRTIGQFGTYTMNQYEMFKRDFGKELKLDEKSPKSVKRFMSQFIVFLVAAYIVDDLSERIFGRQPYDVKDLVDEGRQWAQGDSDVVDFLRQARDTAFSYIPFLGSVKFGSAPPVFEFGKDVFNAVFADGRDREFAQREVLEKWAISVLMPYGGNQLRKTLQGLETTGVIDTPFSRDVSDGKFEVDEGIDALKSWFFGGYVSGGAQEYFDNEAAREFIKRKYEIEGSITADENIAKLKKMSDAEFKVYTATYAESTLESIRKKTGKGGIIPSINIPTASVPSVEIPKVKVPKIKIPSL